MHKKSPSYCKMNICHNYDHYVQKHLGVKTRGCVSGCFFSSSSYVRIGKPTTTVHFAMKFLNYFGLLMGHGEGVWGGVQMQNLVSNWQKRFVLAITSHRMVNQNTSGREIFSSRLCLTSCTPLALLAIFF